MRLSQSRSAASCLLLLGRLSSTTGGLTLVSWYRRAKRHNGRIEAMPQKQSKAERMPSDLRLPGTAVSGVAFTPSDPSRIAGTKNRHVSA